MPEPADTHERIRQRAYELWQQAGSPSGRSEEFWEQAAIEIGNEVLQRDPKPDPEPEPNDPKGTA